MYKYLTKVLKELDFYILPYNKDIFINTINKCIIICYVDNILIIYKNLAYIKEISYKAEKYIKLKEIGSVVTFLGNNISINYKNKIIFIY